MTPILVGLIVFTLVMGYWFLIRPQLKTVPSLAVFWSNEDSFWAAVRLKFVGLKQRITTALAGMAFFVIEINDNVVPLLGSAGIDVDVKKIAPNIPSEVWPFITLGLLLLVLWFRKLAEKRNAV